MAAKYGLSEEVIKPDVLSLRNQLSSRHFLKASAWKKPVRSPYLNSIFLHLTTRCNLSCPHCYIFRTRGEADRELPLALIFCMIDELASHGGKSITLSGGEPLLHPEIKKILAYAAQRVEIRILTNGTLLDRGWANFLADLNVFVQISIDGSSGKIHDSIRGTGTFEKSLEGLAHLQTAGATVNLSTTVMKPNLHDLPQIISLAEQIGVPFVRFLPLRRKGRAELAWEAIGSGVTRTDYEHIYASIAALGPNSWSGLEISCGLSGFLLKMPTQYQQDDIWCAVGRQVVIDVNGDAYPCVLMMEDAFRLGNAFQSRLGDLIRAKTMTGLVQSLNNRRREIEKCAVCNWRNLCQAGCMGQALDHKGTIWDTDDFCDYRKGAYKAAFDRILMIDDSKLSPNH